ncbi:AraC family transcriptional regulator [Paenibacillus sp. HB172176]|uniref:AraC family transcriptional regulator n=1 Tax=Paenibacillus sp. HB172176 TaxID=2493690 RepID=UPI00143A7B13|nr:AraC family transcriptional regulator [Paenibacillus sp. HB172176]
MLDAKFGIKKLVHHSPSEQAKQLPCYIHAMGWRVYEGDMGNRREEGDFYGYQLQYVLRGQGSLIWMDHIYALQAGDLFFIDLGRAHHYRADPQHPWEAVWIHFDGPQAKHYYGLFGETRPMISSTRPERTEAAIRGLFDCFEGRRSVFDLMAASQLIALLTDLIADRLEISRAMSGSRTLCHGDIAKAVAFIEGNMQRPLTIEEIASHAAFSPYHFARMFKRMTGYTVQEYVVKQRITRVKHLLSNSELSLSDIAGRSGFCDQSHMGKVFKRIERMTPAQYRHAVSPAAEGLGDWER